MTPAGTTANRRRTLVALLFALALATAWTLGSPDTETDASAASASTTTHGHATSSASPLSTAKQLAFHDDMRRLWEDHVTWTRLAIVTFADDSAGFPATAARLMKNQEDIGDAIKPFYGTAAGDRLTELLKGHIAIAVDILEAARAGDQQALGTASTAWYANSDEIADFLAGANPTYWPQETMRTSMRAHLDQTLAEASHELGGDHAASVADYEEIHHHILMMADLLSTGIVRTFPGRFR